MHYDLIVIGMGLSGLMAAKAAAEAGLKVLIAGKGTGSLCLFTSTIDVLGRLPEDATMAEGLPSWIRNHPQHPYSKAGLPRIEEALASFISLFPRPYSFQSVDGANSRVPTGAGTFRPTYLLPPTMLAGARLDGNPGLIVGLGGYKDFYANLVADLLGHRGLTVTLPGSPLQEQVAASVSRLMEQEAFRSQLGREIKRHLRGERYVGLPALLGLRDPVRVKQHLEDITGTEVFEIPTLPPSIPGYRIFNHFKERLIRSGVTWLLGHFVSAASVKGKRCETIHLSQPPVTASYSADRFILATGRFVGGGLAAERERIIEPVFSLPVTQPESREGWYQKSFFEPHPIHQAGIATDSTLRPVNDRAEPVLENVWVAGSILAHHDAIAEGSREGIEIVTGYSAATWASKG